MNTTTIGVKSVKVQQAEGDPRLFVQGEFPTIEKANEALRKIRWQCQPDMLGYLKTDVVITWEDGSTQVFRADVNQHGQDTDLTSMLRGWASRISKDERNILRLYKLDIRKSWQDHASRLLNGELAVL